MQRLLCGFSSSPEVNFLATEYEHTAVADITGFFGTFVPKKAGGKGFVSHSLHRGDILVFDVRVRGSANAQGSSLRVCLDSLRFLASVVASMRLPSTIPDSHLDSSDADSDAAEEGGSAGHAAARPSAAHQATTRSARPATASPSAAHRAGARAAAAPAAAPASTGSANQPDQSLSLLMTEDEVLSRLNDPSGTNALFFIQLEDYEGEFRVGLGRVWAGWVAGEGTIDASYTGTITVQWYVRSSWLSAIGTKSAAARARRKLATHHWGTAAIPFCRMPDGGDQRKWLTTEEPLSAFLAVPVRVRVTRKSTEQRLSVEKQCINALRRHEVCAHRVLLADAAGYNDSCSEDEELILSEAEDSDEQSDDDCVSLASDRAANSSNGSDSPPIGSPPSLPDEDVPVSQSEPESPINSEDETLGEMQRKNPERRRSVRLRKAAKTK